MATKKSKATKMVERLKRQAAKNVDRGRLCNAAGEQVVPVEVTFDRAGEILQRMSFIALCNYDSNPSSYAGPELTLGELVWLLDKAGLT